MDSKVTQHFIADEQPTDQQLAQGAKLLLQRINLAAAEVPFFNLINGWLDTVGVEVVEDEDEVAAEGATD